MKRIFILLSALALVTGAAAQENRENGKTGFSFGGFPILAFDQDKGVQMGVRAGAYDFGQNGWYPNPRQQVYVDAAWYTKGSQSYTLSYDNRFLIPGIRFTFTARFDNDKAMDFYGFNGYKSYYDASLPSAYYRLASMVPAGKLDFTGRITDHLYWKFGYHFKYFILSETGSDNLSSLPFGKSLFAWYKYLGFIEADEYKGGMTSAWRAGLCYDSRDAERTPSKGLWADAFLEWAPSWMGTNKPYGRYAAILRQYFPLMGDRLVLAYRANVQGFIGKPAFYVLSWDQALGPDYDREGFGGYHTIRGLMRNRVQGQAVCYFNTELRWTFFSTRVLNQDLSFGANAFFDGGRVLKDYVDISVDEAAWSRQTEKIPSQLLQSGTERFHLSAGGGVRAILNKNFIISLDYGRAFNRQDNGRGGSLYFNMGYLF